MEYNGGNLSIDLIVKPILEQTIMRGLTMVVFQELKSKPGQRPIVRHKVKKKGKSAEELERELQYTRENLQTTIEELETSNEELKSTNEELQGGSGFEFKRRYYLTG